MYEMFRHNYRLEYVKMDKMFTHNMKRRKFWIKCLCRIFNFLHKIKMYKLVTDKLSVIVQNV